MRMCLLGPLAVTGEHGPAVPTAQHPRRVLALLLLRANRPLQLAQVEDELWYGRPPATARTAVQSYVMQIRKSLARGMNVTPADISSTVLVTAPEAYSLVVNAEELDLHRFESKSRQGSRALAHGDAASASVLLSEALDEWSGPAFAGLRLGPVLQASADRLGMLRMAALEQRIQADLELGRHYEVLGELAAAVADGHRFNETMHGHYMTALFRTGRRSDALEVYRSFRRTMLDELGLEPSLHLRRIQRSVLTGEDLGAPAGHRPHPWAAAGR